MTKINIPEQAIRELILDGKPASEVLERCEISGVFERSDWHATASTMINLFSVIDKDHVKQLSLLAVGMLELCSRDRVDSIKRIEKLVAQTVGGDSATGN